MDDPREYVIWSREHCAWWGPDRGGYTQKLERAGLYTHAEAADITVDHIPPGEEVAMLAVVAPRFAQRLLQGAA